MHLWIMSPEPFCCQHAAHCPGCLLAARPTGGETMALTALLCGVSHRYPPQKWSWQLEARLSMSLLLEAGSAVPELVEGSRSGPQLPHGSRPLAGSSGVCLPLTSPA